MEHGIIAWLVIGAIAGWLAGVLVKGGGFGLIVDIIVGELYMHVRVCVCVCVC